MTARKTDKGPATFEESLHKLEQLVERLEQGDVPLEESVRLYEEGIRLSKLCAQKLTEAELTLKRLGKDLEGSFTQLDEEPGE